MAKKKAETTAATKTKGSLSIQGHIDNELGIEDQNPEQILFHYHGKKGLKSIKYGDLCDLLAKWGK